MKELVGIFIEVMISMIMRIERESERFKQMMRGWGVQLQPASGISASANLRPKGSKSCTTLAH